LKSKDNHKSWAALIQLSKSLQQTPTQQLEKNLAPMLDVDGALKFLAWENVLANGCLLDFRQAER
jgi:spore coat protein CotH